MKQEQQQSIKPEEAVINLMASKLAQAEKDKAILQVNLQISQQRIADLEEKLAAKEPAEEQKIKQVK